MQCKLKALQTQILNSKLADYSSTLQVLPCANRSIFSSHLDGLTPGAPPCEGAEVAQNCVLIPVLQKTQGHCGLTKSYFLLLLRRPLLLLCPAFRASTAVIVKVRISGLRCVSITATAFVEIVKRALSIVPSVSCSIPSLAGAPCVEPTVQF